MGYEWLDPRAEIPPPPRSTHVDRRAFARTHDRVLADLGVHDWQRHQVIGMAALESGWGTNRGSGACNPFGLKAKLDLAQQHQQRLGRPLWWFRQAGHVAQGDPVEVRYAAFRDLHDAWTLWLARHVGGPEERPWARIYTEAGRRLWSGDTRWVEELIRAGYAAWTTEAGLHAAAQSRITCAQTVAALLGG